MDLERFRKSMNENQVPSKFSLPLQALWSAGREGEAIESWQEAVRRGEGIRSGAIELPFGPNQLEAIRENALPILQGAREKLDAVGRGEEPPVADIIGLP